jgi:hypothetical protein
VCLAATICSVRQDTATAAEGDASSDAVVSFTAGRFSEFILESDGAVLLFPRDGGQMVRWSRRQKEPVTEGSIQGTVRDAVPTTSGKWLLISQVSEDETLVYECSNSTLSVRARISGSVVDPTLHPAVDGIVWAVSKAGRAYGIGREGIVAHREFGPAIERRNIYTYYAATLSVAVPGQGLWFWSHVQDDLTDLSGHAIQGFDVYQDGTWRNVSNGVGKLGGVILTNQKVLLCGWRDKRAFAARFDGTQLTDLPWQFPVRERCVFLHCTAAGQQLAITHPMDLARFDCFMNGRPATNGGIGALVAIEENGVRPLLEAVDFVRANYDKGRPAVDTAAGTFIAASRAGLVFVSADLKTVKRLDWRYGMPVVNVDRLRIAGDWLYALDRNRGFAILDWRKLASLAEAPGTRRWEVHAVVREPLLGADGTVWYLTASVPRKIRRCDPDGLMEFPLDFIRAGTGSAPDLGTDSKGRVWTFCQDRAAFFDDGKWRSFSRYTSAYGAVAQEERGNASYKIVGPDPYHRPAFSGDGRVAFMDENGGVSYLDGDKWVITPFGKGKIDGNSPSGPPVYVDGILTVQAGDKCYQLVDGQWRATRKSIDPLRDEDSTKHQSIEIPASFPGARQHCATWTLDNADTLWGGSRDALYRGVGDLWVRFPTATTPLMMAESISRVFVDRGGRIWFLLSDRFNGYGRFACFDPPGSGPELTWKRRPASMTENGTISCAVRSTVIDGPRAFRYQCDEGKWEQAASDSSVCRFVLSHLANGTHTCRVRVYDQLLRSSPILTHTFEVKRNYEAEVRAALRQLRSKDLSRREVAVRTLVEIGQPALPALESLLKDGADADQAWWVNAAREEIRRRVTTR